MRISLFILSCFIMLNLLYLRAALIRGISLIYSKLATPNHGKYKVLFACVTGALACILNSALPAFAGEADIKLPAFDKVIFPFMTGINGITVMYFGLVVCFIGVMFAIMKYVQTKRLPAHKEMLNISNIIWETCKSYLIQQGKFLAALWTLIAACIFYYFGILEHRSATDVIIILASSVLGILGSYGVAWFGMRINTLANSRTAFASLQNKPVRVINIPMHSGMSVGLMLVSVELFFMICILIFLKDLAGACFIGFAIGESLGASALRIAGGIFTKIADIGSDLMKIVFKLPEDDPKNPGVIADCTGDNAGDSVGPSADGFETYGVTGVALIAFLAAAFGANSMTAMLIIWIFAMRIIMILTSLVSYFINYSITNTLYGNLKKFNFEQPLTNLVMITSVISVIATFLSSYFLIGNSPGIPNSLWWELSIIISCGTAAGALIPEATKIFTSTSSKHVQEVVASSEHGGASLNILSGFVAGNFSAFWQGLLILSLMLVSYIVSQMEGVLTIINSGGVPHFAAPVFAFGLVAFGFLGMGPVTICVDSFGPVSDNAQSIYELSRIESLPGIKEEIKRDFGFEPDFKMAKEYLEEADGAGNTFKATAKPVLIGTAVVGSTTMVFGIIMVLAQHIRATGSTVSIVEKLSIVQPEIILGLLMGGAVIYWFTGAATQAVVSGAYKAVVFIKGNINLDIETASINDSKEVVKICTQYAQKGMINIFIVIFFLALSFSFFNPYFFIGYLISIAFFGLYQAIFMANSGGAWDNAKKIVEVELKKKGTDLHAATIVGDTVGDPFKDTSSVSMNPVIKFTTLFGLLATEIAITMQRNGIKTIIGSGFLVISIFFIHRSFYGMRIEDDEKLNPVMPLENLSDHKVPAGSFETSAYQNGESSLGYESIAKMQMMERNKSVGERFSSISDSSVGNPD